MKGNIWLLPKRHSVLQKRAVRFLDECVSLPGCRATGGKWPLYPPSFETLALSPTPSFMLLLDEAGKHLWNKEGGERNQKRWKGYSGSRCSFVELCFTALHDCLRLYLEQTYTEVPCAQARTLSLVLASSLWSIVKAGADGFHCYSKNKDHRRCLGTLCSRHTSSQAKFIGVDHF